ncbi:hypothetical protein B0A52_06304 [Exophiala mesophila]|uniref:Transcription factor domain-containing protein n=1 Tax=Exophiala mesophila TaxID=212818 RepID=A0A438N307_EXOME|nr:hypothetical protein B0A52_06304 [Exophiala mesophila]
MTKQLTFILADDVGRTPDTDRLLIRSHVMKGKNQKDTSRRSIRKAKQRKRTGSEQVDQCSHDHGLLQRRRLYDRAEERYNSALTVHRPVASELGLATLASHVDKEAQELLWKFFTYDWIDNDVFPMDRCVAVERHSFAEKFAWLCTDNTFLQFIILASSFSQDFFQRQVMSETTSLQLQRTLKHLNRQLSSNNNRLRDSTLYVIVNLAWVADISGDSQAAKVHMAGLEQLVHLRGGMQVLKSQKKLRVNIERFGFSWALSTGVVPTFMEAPLHWDSFFDHSWTLPEDDLPIPLNNAVFATIVRDFRCLVRIINEHARANRRLANEVFLESVSSIQHRILHVPPMSHDRIADCLRLGILAYLTTAFRVLGGTKRPYRHLTAQFRTQIQALEPNTAFEMDVLCWLVMVGVICLFDTQQPWLIPIWRVVIKQCPTWTELRSRLSNITWIGVIHDELGETAFNEVTRRMVR